LGGPNRGKASPGPLDERVEVLRRDGRVPVHEGQLGVDLPEHEHAPAPRPSPPLEPQEVERDVRVRAQADPPALVRRADELRVDVHAEVERVAQDVRVVGARVALLRARVVELAPRREVELAHLDVGRQGPRVARLRVGELGIPAEEPPPHRLHQAALELSVPARRGEGQRSQDREPHPRILGGAPVERVDELVGLADPERSPEHDLAPDRRERLLDAGLDVGVALHRALE
jgi:hypothetical protein